MRHAHSTSVSKGGVWTVDAGGARAVEGVVNVEQVEAWHSEVWTSAVMLSHCINIRDVRSSIEMVSTSKLGRAMMQRRRVVWAWKSNWYLCIVGVTAFVPARFQASIKLAAYSIKGSLFCAQRKKVHSTRSLYPLAMNQALTFFSNISQVGKTRNSFLYSTLWAISRISSH